MARHTSNMKKVSPRFKGPAPRHFIKQWREYRGYTLEELAEKIGVTHGAIQQLETGKTHYRQQMLEALAEALACSAADLIMRNPLDEDAPWSLFDVWKHATHEKRKQLRKVIEALSDEEKPDGTNG